MMNFLFLHGSWHGAWCWHKVIPRIEAAGHRAIAIDLPGRGRSPAASPFVSLRRMVDAAERSLDRSDKTVVVVHSRSGIVASELAERVPDRIARTIYLASFMLPGGKRVLDYVPDRHSALTGKITINRRRMWDWLDPAIYKEGLYADCEESDVELARKLLVREPIRPALTRVRLSSERYGRVPRAYIRLAQDKAVSLALQDRLLNETTTDRVETIDASHSAYFSRPDALAAAVLKLAGS
jgi:pimeloyl-ACP methyl ester carboxylesterase